MRNLTLDFPMKEHSTLFN